MSACSAAWHVLLQKPCLLQDRYIIKLTVASQSSMAYSGTSMVCPIYTPQPSTHYQMLYNLFISCLVPTNAKERQIWIHRGTISANGCVPVTCGTFQGLWCLSNPLKKYLTHRSNIQYYTIHTDYEYTHNGCVPWRLGWFQIFWFLCVIH